LSFKTQTLRSEAALAAPSANWRDYLMMTKPTVGLLVVVTVIPGVVYASAQMPSPVVVLAALLGTFLAASSAATFNHLIDADIDAHMLRTNKRPMPNGRISRVMALAQAVVLGILSLAILGIGASPLAAWVALAANAFYVLGYTSYLKRRTPQNIVIGGAAGAVGPLIGWAAVSNSLGTPAWLMFGLIFFWTPPHFWALSLKYKDDYAKANIPMLPVVAGDESTRWHVFAYSWTLLPIVTWLAFAANMTVLPAAISVLMTFLFIFWAWRLTQLRTIDAAMRVFRYSILYLFVLFALLTFDGIAALL